MLKVVIDRFEGEYAVVENENGKKINMPKSLLPVGAKEGSVIRVELDEEESNFKKNEMKNLFDSIFK